MREKKFKSQIPNLSLSLPPEFSLSFSLQSLSFTSPCPDVGPVGHDGHPAVEVPRPQEHRDVVVRRDERLRVGHDSGAEPAAGGARGEAGRDRLAAAEDVEGRVDEAELLIEGFIGVGGERERSGAGVARRSR